MTTIQPIPRPLLPRPVDDPSRVQSTHPKPTVRRTSDQAVPCPADDPRHDGPTRPRPTIRPKSDRVVPLQSDDPSRPEMSLPIATVPPLADDPGRAVSMHSRPTSRFAPGRLTPLQPDEPIPSRLSPTAPTTRSGQDQINPVHPDTPAPLTPCQTPAVPTNQHTPLPTISVQTRRTVPGPLGSCQTPAVPTSQDVQLRITTAPTDVPGPGAYGPSLSTQSDNPIRHRPKPGQAVPPRHVMLNPASPVLAIAVDIPGPVGPAPSWTARHSIPPPTTATCHSAPVLVTDRQSWSTGHANTSQTLPRQSDVTTRSSLLLGGPLPSYATGRATSVLAGSTHRPYSRQTELRQPDQPLLIASSQPTPDHADYAPQAPADHCDNTRLAAFAPSRRDTPAQLRSNLPWPVLRDHSPRSAPLPAAPYRHPLPHPFQPSPTAPTIRSRPPHTAMTSRAFVCHASSRPATVLVDSALTAPTRCRPAKAASANHRHAGPARQPRPGTSSSRQARPTAHPRATINPPRQTTPTAHPRAALDAAHQARPCRPSLTAQLSADRAKTLRSDNPTLAITRRPTPPHADLPALGTPGQVGPPRRPQPSQAPPVHPRPPRPVPTSLLRPRQSNTARHRLPYRCRPSPTITTTQPPTNPPMSRHPIG